MSVMHMVSLLIFVLYFVPLMINNSTDSLTFALPRELIITASGVTAQTVKCHEPPTHGQESVPV